MTLVFDQVETVSVNGTKLAYVERGAGEPVVFIHGSVSDLRTWEGQIDAVAASHHAIAYSRRYARPNEDIAPDVDDQMLPHVEDLVSFLAALEIKSAHLIGHSWGGFIALLTAIRHPGRVLSLTLLEPPVLSLFVSTPPKPLELLRLLVRRPKTALAIVKFGATAFDPARKAYLRGDDEAAIRAFGCGVLGRPQFVKLSTARKNQVWDNRAADRAQILGAGFPPLSEDDVRSIQISCKLLVGEDSPAFLRQLSLRLFELIPEAEYAEIPNASHIMHEDNSEITNRIILDFLDRRGR